LTGPPLLARAGTNPKKWMVFHIGLHCVENLNYVHALLSLKIGIDKRNTRFFPSLKDKLYPIYRVSVKSLSGLFSRYIPSHWD
jgi:hypothetical protein